MTDILHTARHLIDNERNDVYGDPAIMWRKVAKVWSTLFGTDITAEQALLAMAALKIVRESINHSEDNLIDAAAYAELIHRVRRSVNA